MEPPKRKREPLGRWLPTAVPIDFVVDRSLDTCVQRLRHLTEPEPAHHRTHITVHQIDADAYQFHITRQGNPVTRAGRQYPTNEATGYLKRWESKLVLVTGQASAEPTGIRDWALLLGVLIFFSVMALGYRFMCLPVVALWIIIALVIVGSAYRKHRAVGDLARLIQQAVTQPKE
jgi:hypothetical protein